MQKSTLHMDLYIICRTNHRTEPKGICYMIGPNEVAAVELVKSCFPKETGKLLQEEGNIEMCCAEKKNKLPLFITPWIILCMM